MPLIRSYLFAGDDPEGFGDNYILTDGQSEQC